MTSEATNALLMILWLGALGFAAAWAWSAISLTNHTLQPVVLKRQPRRRQFPR